MVLNITTWITFIQSQLTLQWHYLKTVISFNESYDTSSIKLIHFFTFFSFYKHLMWGDVMVPGVFNDVQESLMSHVIKQCFNEQYLFNETSCTSKHNG